MTSPQRLVSTLKHLSPRRLENGISRIRVLPSPKSPDNIHEKKAGDEKLLSPFSIDTPDRMKLLKNGLPRKHRSVLGAGAFGTVYKVFYKGDEVAAKVIPRKQNDGEVINSERHATVLRHANIVKILSIEQGSSLSLITMELCGTSLQDRLQESALMKGERVSIWKDIASALQFCHDSGVIHADVKATNILMAANGQAKLTDFGYAGLRSTRSASRRRTYIRRRYLFVRNRSLANAVSRNTFPWITYPYYHIYLCKRSAS